MKILIVDDDNVLRKNIADLLVSANHFVIQADNGKKGFEMAEKNKDIEMVISDFEMPELNGLEMIEKIKNLDTHKKLPTFVLTTKTDKDLRKKSQEIGVLGWIVKPYQDEAILQMVDTIAKSQSA